MSTSKNKRTPRGYPEIDDEEMPEVDWSKVPTRKEMKAILDEAEHQRNEKKRKEKESLEELFRAFGGEYLGD